ncbi:TRAP transporter small permease (plasmid) [Pseudorhodobacter turbinis]|uniref:TRAP transporter small permease protein n=1 Tax=Pseudorhodobacter turbinis TaxID=2500533 RepID=A0A4P8EJS8_9RHOB|nr:TRAP transporter small permease [Pseudorhodobacter turbinis]QCO57248.1 TRAP transporter small permease [Pseudorhodobacter turbinis]
MLIGIGTFEQHLSECEVTLTQPLNPRKQDLAVLRGIYKSLILAETIICYGTFALGTIALIIDIFGREFLGNGVFGAQRFAVYCMALAGMMGFSYVISEGGHLRPSAVDRMFPEGWHAAMARFGDLLSALLCVLLAWAAFTFVSSTYQIGERDMTLPLDLWTIQTVLILAFVFAATKFMIFFIAPALRPNDNGEAM